MSDIIIVWGIEKLSSAPYMINHVTLFNKCLPNDAAILAKEWRCKGWITRIICGKEEIIKEIPNTESEKRLMGIAQWSLNALRNLNVYDNSSFLKEQIQKYELEITHFEYTGHFNE